MRKQTIALCLIAKNEEHNLPRLLKSVEGCFDEIHLTDTGSTDKTVEVAESMGCKVHHFEWCDDFSAARNYSFSFAKTDFKMWLDCDDVLDNPEGFRYWRDNIMNVADFWAAVYHYALDESGKPTCSFLRERVVRTARNVPWLYPIHEGLVPTGETPLRSQLTNMWTVKHMRSEKDLAGDKARNLKVIERHYLDGGKTPDARMLYYWGKELFENGRQEDCIEKLAASLGAGISGHDWIIASQYLAFAYLAKGQLQEAYDISVELSKRAPTRAEAYCVSGDALVRMGKLTEALPRYAAAMSCVVPSDASLTFSSKHMYNIYPINQTARVYFHLNKPDMARQAAQVGIERYGSEESKNILAEINRLSVVHSFDSAKACDDIVVTCPSVSAYTFDPEIEKTKAMGGSETALIEMAKHLHKQSGRRVVVFNMRETEDCYDGVYYKPARLVHEYMRDNKPWLHVAWRHNIKLTDAPTFVWSHDLQTPGVENTSVYNKVMCLTPFHARYMHGTQGIPMDKILVTRNGIRSERFMGENAVHWTEKNPMMFVFSNSPDRGLDRVMLVLDQVRRIYPVELHVFYGIEHLSKYGLGDLQSKLQKMMDERKEWVHYHGATQQDKMLSYFRRAAYWVSPSDWIETSMISAMELVCSGVYPIFRGIGGVVDTLGPYVQKGMATLVDSEAATKEELSVFVEHCLEAIRDEKYKLVKADPMEHDWSRVAGEWLEELPKHF